MSIQTELDRIIGLVHESHEKAQAKGGAATPPLLANLPGVIESIPQGVELPALTNPGSASDLLSGKQLIDADGNVVTGNIATKAASDLTASGATVTVPAGYYASKATKSVATATQATPSVSIDSAGKITASATQTAGYVAAGTKTGTKQLTTQAAKTITPTKSPQTAVDSGRYTTGAVIVAAIPDSYVQPSGTLDVTENGTHDVKNYASVNVNVASSGGGGSAGGSIETGTFTVINNGMYEPGSNKYVLSTDGLDTSTRRMFCIVDDTGGKVVVAVFYRETTGENFQSYRGHSESGHIALSVIEQRNITENTITVYGYIASSANLKWIAIG